MKTPETKRIFLLLSLTVTILIAGCGGFPTNWKQKYQALNVENENLRGLLERAKSEKSQLASRVTEGQQTIEQLQKQIAEQAKSPAEASGFGEGYDVSFDRAAGTITVTLPNSILFPSGKASLKKSNITELNHIYSVLNSKYSGRMIDVVGHTDSDPIKKSDWEDNWELSAQRALSVLRYLVKRGIPRDQIRAIGRGASQAIASNATASGKAKNRRVEIVVHMR